MTYDEILSGVKTRTINCAQAFESLSEIGYSPNLVSDDDGRWAVTFDGMQNVPIGNVAGDMAISCYVPADYWRETIYEALIFSMEK